MSATASRQLLLLAALAALLVVVFVARQGAFLSGPSVAGSNPARTAVPAASKAQPVADVRLESLESARPDLDPPTRNPFQFRERAISGSSRPPGFAGRPPMPVVGPPAPPPGPPPLPPIALKYIGVLETSQGRMGVFKDAGGEIINGAEGEILDGRYRLMRIGVESADLSYADGRGRQTIRLSGQ